MLPVMDMPGLKSWIHWLVMDALTEAMVDPGKVNIRFDRLGPSNIPSKSSALTNGLCCICHIHRIMHYNVFLSATLKC